MKITNFVFFIQKRYSVIPMRYVGFYSKIVFGLVTFAKALEHLFGLDYVLGLVYPAQILKTLDFLQRCTFKIHSDNSRRKEMSLSASNKVSRLISSIEN
jgi:hypothetical protein